MNQTPPDDFFGCIDRRKPYKGSHKSNRKYKDNDKLERLYWKIVKTHISGKYNQVKSFLEKFSDDEIEQLEGLENTLANNLLDKIYKSKINLNIGGDDSYFNMCYNILSHGKKIYYDVLKNPNILYKKKELAHEGSGSDNFIMNYFLLY
jgi:hypothetical protein